MDSLQILPGLYGRNNTSASENEHYQTHSMKLVFLIPKPEKNATKEANCRPFSSMNTNTKLLNKILANQIQQYI
jgi:hypothetical protein